MSQPIRKRDRVRAAKAADAQRKAASRAANASVARVSPRLVPDTTRAPGVPAATWYTPTVSAWLLWTVPATPSFTSDSITETDSFEVWRRAGYAMAELTTKEEVYAFYACFLVLPVFKTF